MCVLRSWWEVWLREVITGLRTWLALSLIVNLIIARLCFVFKVRFKSEGQFDGWW